jgi:hypothetical protein
MSEIITNAQFQDLILQQAAYQKQQINLILSETSSYRKESAERYIQQREEDLHSFGRLELQNAEIRAQSAEIITKVNNLEVEIREIKKNTLIIKGIAISQVSGMGLQDKEQLEKNFSECLDDPEVQEIIEVLNGNKPCALVRKPSGKFVKRQYAHVRFADVAREIGGMEFKTARTSAGIFISGVVRDVFSTDFASKYPAKMLPGLALLLLHSQTSKPGRQY